MRKLMNEQRKSKVNNIHSYQLFHSICLTIVDAIKICFAKQNDVQADVLCNHQGRIIRGNQRRGLVYRHRLVYTFFVDDIN